MPAARADEGYYRDRYGWADEKATGNDPLRQSAFVGVGAEIVAGGRGARGPGAVRVEGREGGWSVVAGRAREPGRSVVSRVMAVLAAFDAGHPRLTLSEVARRSEVPVATTARLLRELATCDALVRYPDGRYAVGQRLWQLGLLAPVNQELREVALPFMHDIHAATGDVVHLAVREGTYALYVERMVGSGSVPVLSRMGARLPLHATGVGKVLLAEAPPEVLQVVLAGLRRVTGHTIVEPGRLLRELAGTRRRGYARTSEEMTLGSASIAVPIRPAPGPPVAALGVVTSASSPKVNRLLPALQVAAAAMGRALHGGATGPYPR
jgi:DNA-binding IclR family transcriptional regulator